MRKYDGTILQTNKTNKISIVDSKRMKTTKSKADASVPGAGGEPIT